MNEWLVYDHPEMCDWCIYLGYIFRKGAVGKYEGIKFVIHTAENGHNKPHLHASYQGREIVLEIPDGKILRGSLGNKKDKQTQKWVRTNADSLKKHWNELVAGVYMFG
ncbi:MAG: DUF4160 domain-containing protein [Coriobacteriales bacterium]